MTPAPITHTPRRWRRTAVASLGALALLATAGPAAEAHSPRPIGPRLQTILDRAAAAPDATFPGVGLYAHRPGQKAFSGAAGTANIKTGRPMRASDRLHAGSIMKPFVAAATLQLVEEGKFSLNDTLPKVLPASVLARFPEAAQITVRMLLNHTSGIADYTDGGFNGEVLANMRRHWTTAEVLDRAAALPRAGAPGERFNYSNANYNLLGLIIERATGKPWRTEIRERIFKPLHLRHSSLPAEGVVATHRGTAHGYEPVDGKLVDVTDIDTSMAGAAGGHALVTTVGDLSHFLHAVLAGRLFHHHATVKEMRTFVPASDPSGLIGYGFGLERYALPGGIEVLGHVGTTGGYRTLMFHLPAQDIDLTMTMNSPGDPLPVLMPALKVLLGK